MRHGIWAATLAAAIIIGGGTARAQAPLGDLLTVTTTINSPTTGLNITFGSDGQQQDENCPGYFPGSAQTEDIYDFGQDGIPDYAQMAMVAALNAQAVPEVVAALNTMRGLWSSVDLGGFNGLQAVNAFNPSANASHVADALTYWLVVDRLANGPQSGCIDPTLGSVLAVYANAAGPSADLKSIVDGGVDYNGNGKTNLEAWQAAVAAEGGKTFVGDDAQFLATVDAFVELATTEPAPLGDLLTVATTLNSPVTGLNITFGSDGQQQDENCPGYFPGSAQTEDIYDFGQDGIPDYAQMALVESLNNQAVPQVVDALTIMRGLWSSIDLGGFNGLQAVNAFNPGANASHVADALTYWLVVDRLANGPQSGCIDPTLGGVLAVYANAAGATADLKALLDGGADLDNDGVSNLEEWQNAVAAEGGKTFAGDDQQFLDTVALFVQLAQDGQGAGTEGEGEGEGEAEGEGEGEGEGEPVVCPNCAASATDMFEAGEAACLVVDAPGGSGFVWSKDASPLSNTSRVSGVACDTLRIIDLRVTDTGTYRCDYDDGNKAPAFVEFTITVTPLSGVPAAGLGGLALLTVLSALGGAVALRRK